jgi:ABC-type maltose transport system permease subunit
MNHGQKNSLGVYGAYAIVAFFGVLGTVVVAIIATVHLSRFTVVSELAFLTPVMMVTVPAVMAGVIASYIHRTHTARANTPATVPDATPGDRS